MLGQVGDNEEQDEQNSVTNGSSGDSVRNIPSQGIPRKFKLKLSEEEWQKIKPEACDTKLTLGWADLLSSKLYEQSPYCVMKFNYHHVRKLEGRKKNVPYFRAKAKCKFEGCAAYKFKIKTKPLQYPLSIFVRRIGNVHHVKSSTHKRVTRKPERKKIAKRLQSQSISAWYYRAYAKLEDEAKMGGNLTEPKTQAILRKIRSEQLLEGNLHVDPLQEVKILNDVYRDIETDGFIRFLAIHPFQCHMYLREQILAYVQENKKHSAILFFDATGSIVQKIPGQTERIFLYSLVMENTVEGRSALPIAELLSNDHHTSEIRHFLSVFCNNVKLQSSKIVPRRVETDLSWAIIQGVVQTFNEQNVKNYLDYIWDVTRKRYSLKELQTKTYLHTCSAHMLQIFIRTLNLKNREKGLSDFVLRILSCLLNCTSIKGAREIFGNLCDVMIPKYKTKYSRASLEALTELVKQKKPEEVDIEEIEKHEVPFLDEEILEDTSVLKRSKFYR